MGREPYRSRVPKYSSVSVRGVPAALLEEDDEPLTGSRNERSVGAESSYLDDCGVWLSGAIDSVEGHGRDRTIRASRDCIGQHAARQLDSMRPRIWRRGHGVDDGPGGNGALR